MKNLFALILFFSSGASAQTIHCNQKKYSIEIFDYNFSMAYTTRYHVFDDSLTITNLSGIEGEHDSCLVAKKMSKNQSEKVYNFLYSLDIKALKNKYENPFVEDGDRKDVIICFNDKMKTIEINNTYQKDMANLFDVINQIIDTKFKVRYKSK